MASEMAWVNMGKILAVENYHSVLMSIKMFQIWLCSSGKVFLRAKLLLLSYLYSGQIFINGRAPLPTKLLCF